MISCKGENQKDETFGKTILKKAKMLPSAKFPISFWIQLKRFISILLSGINLVNYVKYFQLPQVNLCKFLSTYGTKATKAKGNINTCLSTGMLIPKTCVQ